MTELKAIETGTDLGTVYINPDHVTHITPNLGSDVPKGEFSVIWLVSGKIVSVEGKPHDVEMKLFPFVH